jgi:hypothetical protein
VLTELGDWLVEGLEADELRVLLSCPQMAPEDAARLGWLSARAGYPGTEPGHWLFRCRSRERSGLTLLRFFRVPPGSLNPVATALSVQASPPWG